MCVDHANAFVKPQNTTRDAFLGGQLTLAQPAKGFRAGSDSVLLGASVSEKAARILDLGAGVGAAGLVAAFWAKGAEVLMAECDDPTFALLTDNISGNGFGARVFALRADVTASGPDREAAGLMPDSFDTVIANPPFFAKGRGTPAAGVGRDTARHADAADLDAWVRCAASTAAPRGETIFILPANRLGEALRAFDRRFGDVRVLPVAARPGAEAGRILIRGIKGSRAGLRLLAPLVLHGVSGNAFAPDMADILMGRAKLDW